MTQPFIHMYLFKENEDIYLLKNCTQMFILVLLIFTPNWKQPKYQRKDVKTDCGTFIQWNATQK